MTDAPAVQQTTRVAPRQPALEPAAYARVFDQFKEGQQILEELIRLFSKPAKLEGGIDAITATYHRAGQRSVVEFIVSRINQANGVPDSDESE